MANVTVLSVKKAVRRLKDSGDDKMRYLHLYNKEATDADLRELFDCLLARPDVVWQLSLANNRLTDETGVRLARFVAASSSLEMLSLYRNRCSETTYLAMAAALRVNTSLVRMCLAENLPQQQARVDAAFVEALRYNPVRSPNSSWWLYAYPSKVLDYQRLREQAEQAGHLSLQSLLLIYLFDSADPPAVSCSSSSPSCLQM